MESLTCLFFFKRARFDAETLGGDAILLWLDVVEDFLAMFFGGILRDFPSRPLRAVEEMQR